MDWKYLLLSFHGRINRQPFWIAILVLAVVRTVVTVLDNQLALGPSVFENSDTGSFVRIGLLSVLTSLVVFVMSLALSVKRLHDRDRSGWFYLLFFIPILNLWPFIEVGFLRGTFGPNRYGPDPLPLPAGFYTTPAA